MPDDPPPSGRARAGEAITAPPRGPVLFPAGSSAGFRRRRIAFAAAYAAVAAGVVWPLYPLAASAFPLILGLPLSFAWVVGALAAGFAALVALYLGDAREEARRGDGAGPTASPGRSWRLMAALGSGRSNRTRG